MPEPLIEHLGLDISKAQSASTSLLASLRAHIGRKCQVQFLNPELGKSGQEVQQI